jgi:hypothetical protein
MSAVSVEYLEQLVSEWYEYQGYFVRKDLWVGFQADGSYECELDVVAFHPTRRHVVHIEPSYDLLSWSEKERHFQSKFDAGKKYLHRMFGGESHLHVEQVALILESDGATAHTIGGGKIVLLSDFLAEILQRLCGFDMSSSTVPEQWPLIRTLQYVVSYRHRIAPLLAAALEPARSAR